jgi:hypothetical protein
MRFAAGWRPPGADEPGLGKLNIKENRGYYFLGLVGFEPTRNQL